MGILLIKQKGLVLTSIAKLAVVLFISMIALSFVDTIWAVYIDNFVNNVSVVGFFSASLTLVSFICFFLIIPIIQKRDKSKIYAYSLLLFALAYILFAINTKFYGLVILAFILTVLHTLRITSFGIIIKDNSPKKYLARNEGLIYTFMNSAWLIGPLLAGFLAEKFNISLIFILAAVFIFLAFFLFKISGIKDFNRKRKANKNIIRNFIKFFKSKDRVLAYVLGGGVNFWWSLIYLFMPLFIIRNGLTTKWIGIFLFGIVVPLILFQYVFGSITGKTGFKKIFIIGFFIPSTLAFSCFFINNIFIIMGLLIIASLGLAMLEPTTEAYFFDILKKKEELRFYGPYNTTIDVNSFISRILSAVVLLFLPFQFIFLIFGSFMLLFCLLSFWTKNIIEKER